QGSGGSDAGGRTPGVAVYSRHGHACLFENLARRPGCASARQPSSSSAVTDDATTMKLAASHAEVALDTSIPTTTVHSHTTTPVGCTAVGRRHARAASHPTAVPLRKGHAVEAMP